MTDDARALELYRLALSIADAKGRLAIVGVVSYKEFRGKALSIRYFPISGTLELWHQRKVLVVYRIEGEPQVVRYLPGSWEKTLEDMGRALTAQERKT